LPHCIHYNTSGAYNHETPPSRSINCAGLLTGEIAGTRFIDRRSGREVHANARAVLLGASCLESTRILLNSRLANSSSVLGHYMFDQFYVKHVVTCIVPEARGRATRGLIGGGGYIPRFRNLEKGETNFLRGYAYDFNSGGTPAPEYFPL